MNVPLARYSRDETAVVNGGTGSSFSSLAPRFRIQPSGALTVAGTPESTRPSSGGAASAATGAMLGSAPVKGAVATDMAKQTVSTAARRTTRAIGVTPDTVNAHRSDLRHRPGDETE